MNVKKARGSEANRMPEQKKTVRVAAAIIERDGLFFATQRGYGPAKDGWEFPGGKIEPGETAEQALAREIREELDTEIAVGEKIVQAKHDERGFHLSMACFLCRVISGSLTLKEHEAARWLSLEEIDSVDWLPADRIVVEALKNRERKRT